LQGSPGEARFPSGARTWYPMVQLGGAHLNEVPALVQAALDFVTVQELGQPALGVVHQTAGVREECGGP
jgi:hypothetical protein